MNASKRSTLYVNGSVYSAQDPFATAMLVEGPDVVWLGNDDAARAQLNLARVEGTEVDVVDLQGCLVTPGFYNSALVTGTGLQKPESAGWVETDTIEPASEIWWTGTELSDTSERIRLFWGPGDPLSRDEAQHVSRDLAARSVTVVALPDDDGVVHAPLASLASAGVPLALGTGVYEGYLRDPWGLVAACVQHPQPEQRFSARAAFLALSRGGWRARGVTDPLAGQLGIGSSATFAVWEASELMVQTPDSVVSSWSTDPRAGTPMLPALDGPNHPGCMRTVIAGDVVYDKAQHDTP